MVGVYAAIITDESVFKHWAIFIDEPHEPEKIMLQARGSDGRFRYEPEYGDARCLSGLDELVFLFDVKSTETSTLKAVASDIPVRSDIHGWNCQDWVLDFLDKLEEEDIINGADILGIGRFIVDASRAS
ncbi:hypothetical protein BDV41DRAFT_576507 [Aspergillus transmontanensis]|uniref:Uncharacterized protein n=1 Tax=Aspergillus transmontanensis TaxID=1034304 RepID=A0A5N6VZ91_9EURO|nr:hypothetical protein BDV41DRAFT_576507 [Aspergillus transmontanensis]